MSVIFPRSDEGSFYIWERPSNKIFSVYKGDPSIVNCVQPHPYCCLLATSGIDSKIRLWSPKPENDTKLTNYRITQFESKVILNQERMQSEPCDPDLACRAS